MEPSMAQQRRRAGEVAPALRLSQFVSPSRIPVPETIRSSYRCSRRGQGIGQGRIREPRNKSPLDERPHRVEEKLRREHLGYGGHIIRHAVRDGRADMENLNLRTGQAYALNEATNVNAGPVRV